MNIRSKIMLSIAIGAAVAALAVGTISVFSAKSIVIVAAIISAFCAVAAVCGLLIAESINITFNASGDGRLTGTDEAAKLNAADQAKLAAKANAAVKRMTKAADRIKAASARNAKIIKRFNYTAIRAHLLAFRTTIKAARAGDGGNGYAFIADEVRNFAQRCSVAAKKAADMIEESVREADNGVKLVEDAAKSIGKIVVNTEPVTLAV
jgi:methyl-accepting chemotaxis protein